MSEREDDDKVYNSAIRVGGGAAYLEREDADHDAQNEKDERDDEPDDAPPFLRRIFEQENVPRSVQPHPRR